MIAAYVRVSTLEQNDRLQREAIDRWAQAQGVSVTYYSEKGSGTTMARAAWERLESDFRAGRVEAIVIWKLDRIGRNMSGVAALLDELRDRKINLISLTEGFNFDQPAGRMMAGIVASFAAYETEIRKERQAAGIAAVRNAPKGARIVSRKSGTVYIAKGDGRCPWGGRRSGYRTVDAAKRQAIEAMLRGGASQNAAARAVGISPNTLTRYIREGLIASPQKNSGIAVDKTPCTL